MGWHPDARRPLVWLRWHASKRSMIGVLTPSDPGGCDSSDTFLWHLTHQLQRSAPHASPISSWYAHKPSLYPLLHSLSSYRMHPRILICSHVHSCLLCRAACLMYTDHRYTREHMHTRTHRSHIPVRRTERRVPIHLPQYECFSWKKKVFVNTHSFQTWNWLNTPCQSKCHSSPSVEVYVTALCFSFLNIYNMEVAESITWCKPAGCLKKNTWSHMWNRGIAFKSTALL